MSAQPIGHNGETGSECSLFLFVFVTVQLLSRMEKGVQMLYHRGTFSLVICSFTLMEWD